MSVRQDYKKFGFNLFKNLGLIHNIIILFFQKSPQGYPWRAQIYLIDNQSVKITR